MSVVINGSTGVFAPAVDANGLITGQTAVITDSASVGSITFPDGSILSANSMKYTAGITTSGAVPFDITGIPAWATEIDVIFEGCSLSSTGNPLVQVEGNAGFIATGYITNGHVANAAALGTVNDTTGFEFYGLSAAYAYYGRMKLQRNAPTSNIWFQKHDISPTTANQSMFGAGYVTVPGGEIRSIRITRTGTDTYDAGTVYVAYR